MRTISDGPRYNKSFMTALLQAHVLSKKAMIYKGNRYIVKDHIKDAVRDIEDGWYSIEAKPSHPKSNDFDMIDLK